MPPSGQGRWGRLRPVQLDPLDVYGLPSKGETRLHDWKTQERYYTKIIERYLAFCTEANGRDGLMERFASLETARRHSLEQSEAETEAEAETPGPGLGPGSRAGAREAAASAARRARAAILPPSPTKGSSPPKGSPSKGSPAKDLSDVLMALRKLREAIVATKRADAFSIQVYLFCIRVAVLARQPEAYHPAILYLLRVMHRRHPLTRLEADEATGYLVLDAACRRGDLAEAYRLRCVHRFRHPLVDAVLAALVRDDWLAFRRLQQRVDGHQAQLLAWAAHGLRVHTLKCFGRAYLRLDDVAYLEAATGLGWSTLQAQYGVGWEREGRAVIIRKVRARAVAEKPAATAATAETAETASTTAS